MLVLNFKQCMHKSIIYFVSWNYKCMINLIILSFIVPCYLNNSNNFRANKIIHKVGKLEGYCPTFGWSIIWMVIHMMSERK